MRWVDGILLRLDLPELTYDAAMDLVGDALGAQAHTVAVPGTALGREFTDLSTRVAGDVLQKFVNYRIALAVVGPLPDETRSASWDAFASEHGRAGVLRFVPDADTLSA